MMGDPAVISKTTRTVHGQNARPLRLGRLWLHVGLGLLSLWVALEFLSPKQEQFFTGLIASITSIIEVSRLKIPKFNDWILQVGARLAHEQESARITSATWFWLAMFPISLIGNELVLALTLAVLSLGDQVAGVVGRRFGTISLGNGRSLQGSLAFVLSSALLCLALLHVYFPELSTSETLWLVAVASCSGAVCEMLCSKIDDNFGVGIGTGLCVWAAVSILGLG